MEIDLLVIGMVVAQIITHKMVMARREAMTGMAVHEEVLIGMEVEWQLEMKEGATGVGLVHMIARAGVAVHHHLTATDFLCCLLMFLWEIHCSSHIRDLVLVK